MNIFGTRSEEKLHTCHIDMQLIMRESLKVSQVDFGISEGERSDEKQQYYYASGRTRPGPILTNKDGINKKSKHQKKPSPATDIYAYVARKPELSYSSVYLAYLGGVITSVAQKLLNEGRISHKIRWGANFDMDKMIFEKNNFIDAPHFELI